jgi:hypothetical protein
VTPLLDWSLSPFVAPFFAFVDRLDVQSDWDRKPITLTPPPIAVWSLYYDKTVTSKGEFEIFTSTTGGVGRQLAQAGLFSMLTHDWATDVERYLAVRGKLALLTKYEIPGTEAMNAIATLQQMNIRFATLFPDVQGAAWEANTAGRFRTAGLSGS